jgi:hypothetical protein
MRDHPAVEKTTLRRSKNMDEKKTLTIKCAHDNRPVTADIVDGRIDAKCKHCGLTHTGTAEAWGSIFTDHIRLQAPLKLHKRLTINFE